MNPAISASATARSIGSPSCSSSAHSEFGGRLGVDRASDRRSTGSGSRPTQLLLLTQVALRGQPGLTRDAPVGCRLPSARQPFRRSGGPTSGPDRPGRPPRSWSENRSGAAVVASGADALSRSWQFAQIAAGELRHPPTSMRWTAPRSHDRAGRIAEGDERARRVLRPPHPAWCVVALDAADRFGDRRPVDPLGETSVGESRSSTGTIAAPTPSASAERESPRHPQPSSSSRSSSIPAACATSWITVTNTSSANSSRSSHASHSASR